MDKAQMAQPYLEFLSAQGYSATIDGDGDVRFKNEGRTYFVMLDQDDPAFFRLLLPSITNVTDAADRREAYEAANSVTSTTKVAKVWVAKTGQVHVAIEMFVSAPGDIGATFDRSMSAIESAARSFLKLMQG